jgi:hypothetical protein
MNCLYSNILAKLFEVAKAKQVIKYTVKCIANGLCSNYKAL